LHKYNKDYIFLSLLSGKFEELFHRYHNATDLSIENKQLLYFFTKHQDMSIPLKA